MSSLGHASCPVVLAAPSGTGKTTIAKALVQSSDAFVFSVSATTREPRSGETDGVDYRFVSEERFEAMIEAGELAEWALVHDRLYGTLRSDLDAAMTRGEHVVLDIDVQGAMQIRESVPEAILVFVLPPSVDTLTDRLTRRGTERTPEVARRLRSALDELQLAKEFDYVVVNDDLQRCVHDVQTIVSAEGYRPRRASALEADLERLRSEIGRMLETEFANANA